MTSPLTPPSRDLLTPRRTEQLFELIRRFLGTPRTAVAALTLTATVPTVEIDATAGAVAVTLPPAAQNGSRTFTVKKIDASANAVTLTASGADLIDGAATLALTAQYQGVTVLSDGVGYLVVSEVGFGGGGGGGGTTIHTGTVELDFGAFPGASDASLAVTGQAGITAASVVRCWLEPVDTTDHTADEHLVETLRVEAGTIVAGTGFTVYGFNSNPVAEPLALPGIARFRSAATSVYGSGGQPSVGGLGTRLWGKWTVRWMWF